MAFQFDTDGFLSANRTKLAQGIENLHHVLFERAQAVNRDCHDLLFSCEVHNRDVREMLAATLFLRALEHFQATVLLLEGGIVSSAKVSLRATLEAVWSLRAIAIDEAFASEYIQNDRLRRLRIGRNSRNHSFPALRGVREAITDEEIAELRNRKSNRKVKDLKPVEISRRAGMEEWYLVVYPLLSSTAHTGVRELEDYFILNESDDVSEIRYAPMFNEIPELLFISCECIMLGAWAVATIFEIDAKEKFSDHLAFIARGGG